MIFHPDFLFGHLEKTGGTFIEKYLTTNIPKAKHKRKVNRHDSFYNCMPDTDVLKFGYIRNPYDWYVSFWAFTQKHRVYKFLLNNYSGNNVNMFIEDLFKSDKAICYNTDTVLKSSTDILRPFDLYVSNKLDIGLLTYRYLYIYYHPDVFKDIQNYKKYKIVDKVLQFENLLEEFVTFFKENLFELDEDKIYKLYSMKKIRVTKHDHYSKYYTKKTIDLIQHKDRIIFKEHNNYEF